MERSKKLPTIPGGAFSRPPKESRWVAKIRRQFAVHFSAAAFLDRSKNDISTLFNIASSIPDLACKRCESGGRNCDKTGAVSKAKHNPRVVWPLCPTPLCISSRDGLAQSDERRRAPEATSKRQVFPADLLSSVRLGLQFALGHHSLHLGLPPPQLLVRSLRQEEEHWQPAQLGPETRLQTLIALVSSLHFW